MEMIKERAKRVKLYYCSLKLRRVQREIPEERESTKMECGFIKNISESGMCISTSSSLTISDNVRLAFELPSIEQIIDLKGRVVWVKKNGVGLEFQDVGKQEMNSIKNCLDKFDKEDMYRYYQKLQEMFTYSQVKNENERKEVQKLRYMIYAKENNWEPINDTGLEVDEYDEGSESFMVSDNHDVVIAATRMIPADKYELPIEKHFGVDITQGGALSRSEIVEISRLCIAKEYRRRIEDLDYSHSLKNSAVQMDANIKMRARAPNLLIGLWKQMYQYASLHNKKCWYLVIESRLTNSIMNAGIKLVKVGEARNYHGLRTPYFCDLTESEELFAAQNPMFLQWLQKSVVTRVN